MTLIQNIYGSVGLALSFGRDYVPDRQGSFVCIDFVIFFLFGCVLHHVTCDGYFSHSAWRTVAIRRRFSSGTH